MRVTPLGVCLRGIVNEKSLNLEKTTYSIQSVIVNNGRTWKRSIGRLG